MSDVTDVTGAEICVVACADAWRGDGEILASPIGTIPMLGARLASLTFEPDLVLTDGDAVALEEPLLLGAAWDHPRAIESWLPFGNVFSVVWAGKRHTMMGASQIDAFGNQNIACIGDWRKPKVQLLGVRGAPGNTINHTTSYFIPSHSTRTFVPQVDVVSGVGYDRAAAAGPSVARFHELRRVVTDKAVLDFETPDHRMRLRSVHPGVTVDEVVEHTGFALVVADTVPETRLPDADELRVLRSVLDPGSVRDREL